jgi:hypothetical protein
MIRSISVRHAHAAAGTWSSSRPSSAGGNLGLRRMRRRSTGSLHHDPAWSAHDPSRCDLVPGDQPRRTLGARQRRKPVQRGALMPIRSAAPLPSEPIRPRSIAPQRSSHRSQSPAASVIPIDHRRGLRGSYTSGFSTPDGARNPSTVRKGNFAGPSRNKQTFVLRAPTADFKASAS